MFCFICYRSHITSTGYHCYFLKKPMLLLNILSTTGGHYWALKSRECLCAMSIVVATVSFRKDHVHNVPEYSQNITKIKSCLGGKWLLTAQKLIIQAIEIYVIVVQRNISEVLNGPTLVFLRNRPDNYLILTDLSTEMWENVGRNYRAFNSLFIRWYLYKIERMSVKPLHVEVSVCKQYFTVVLHSKKLF